VEATAGLLLGLSCGSDAVPCCNLMVVWRVGTLEAAWNRDLLALLRNDGVRAGLTPRS